MAHISINLLPIEFTQEEVKRAKFYKVQAVCVAIILMMVFLASLTVALRILQSHNISQIKTQFTQAEQKVSNLKNRETSLVILKNRLTVINQYLGTPSKQVAVYNLIDKLLPPAVSINSFLVDKSGDVSLVGVVPDSLTIDSLIDSLTNKEKNEGKVSGVSIESLNRGRDGIYRISLKVKSK